MPKPAAPAVPAKALGIEVWRVLFPLGMDANDYALAGKSLAEAVRGAEWVGKGSATTAEVSFEDGVIATDDPRAVPSVVPIVTKPPMVTTSPMTATSTDDMLFTFGDRRWGVRGIDSISGYGTLKVNVLVSRKHAGFHIDTFDLYSARHRLAFIKQAACEIGATDAAVKAELGSILLELEGRVDEQIRAKLKPVATTPTMTDEEQSEALALLREPRR